MNKINKAWEKFKLSGKVEDYLNYRKVLENENNGGNSFKDNSLYGK